jgi:hypothetical protein
MASVPSVSPGEREKVRDLTCAWGPGRCAGGLGSFQNGDLAHLPEQIPESRVVPECSIFLIQS